MSHINTKTLDNIRWAKPATFVHIDHGKIIDLMLDKIDAQWGADKSPEAIRVMQVGVLMGFIRYAVDVGYNDGREKAADTIKELILNDNTN